MIDSRVQVFICFDLNEHTLGMWACPRCKELTYLDHDANCNLSPEEVAEVEELELAEMFRPDTDADEVAMMLHDIGLVEFCDPLVLYQLLDRQDEPTWAEVI